MKWYGLLALLCVSACSWVIDPESRPVRCAETAADTNPCPAGQSCVRGLCKADCTGTETCSDGIDNDCDGATDEFNPDLKDACGDNIDNDCDGNTDEGHDQDGDKSNWCGDPRLPGGGPTADCDNQDANVSPNADERCDGVDNDCDGITDETSNNKALCSGTEQCLGQRCVVPSCAVPEAKDKACGPDEMCNVQTGICGPKLCDESTCNQAGEYCDEGTGECRTERKNNGDACAGHGDCKSLSCVESSALRLTVTSPRVCMQTCCSDADCVSGERCFASGTGARSCLPADKVPPAAGAAELCTLDSQCKAGQVCAVITGQQISGSIVQTRRNLTTGACRTVISGERVTGEACGSVPCQTNACVLVDYYSAVCSQACRTSADCSALAELNRSVYCRFLTTSNMSGGDYVPICVGAGNEIGAGSVGAKCSSGSNCKDGACVGATSTTTGFCAPTCCNDSQCGSLGETRTYCRPVAFGDHYETRCVR